MRHLRALVLSAALLVAGENHAAPVPDDERVPLDLRRTTLVVRDMDAALAFYRDAVFERARNTPGVRVLSEPSATSYPSYDGIGTIPVRVSVLQDPDGYVVELNQLLVHSLR